MIGVLPPPLNPNKQTLPSFLVGSEIGGREFVKSMLRYLPAQSINLFVPESSIGSTLRELMRLSENEEGNFCSARVWGLDALPTILKIESFLAFHDVSNPLLDQLSYIRSQFATRAFPITALLHGFSDRNLLWQIFAHLLATPTLPCDSVICTSVPARDAFRNILEYMQESLRDVGITGNPPSFRLDVIPLGVDTQTYRPRDKKEVRSILGLPLDKTILLYFGRIDHVSKVDLIPLLFVFRELANRFGEPLVLVLAGNVNSDSVFRSHEHIQRTAERLGCGRQVLLRSRPSLMEGPLYYAAADIFVSPVETLQESFGLSPLEAMASGLPVVVSDWDGYKDTIVHGQTGFRVTTYWAKCDHDISLLSPFRSWETDHLRLAQSVAVDTEELCHYLDLLLGNPERRAAMGQAAREHVLAHCDWACVIARVYALWQELAEIARSLPPPKPLARHPEQARYFEMFGHFASRCLDGSECLEITDRGRHACRRAETILLPPGMEGYLDPKVLVIVLNFVKLLGFFKHRPTVQDACAKISRRHHLTPSQTLAHVLWLLKYGFLRIARV